LASRSSNKKILSLQILREQSEENAPNTYHFGKITYNYLNASVNLLMKTKEVVPVLLFPLEITKYDFNFTVNQPQG